MTIQNTLQRFGEWDIKLKRNKKAPPYHGFQQLKHEIMQKTVLLICAAMTAVFLLYRFVFFGRFANFVVGFLDHFVYQEYDVAYNVYQQVFRNNIDIIFLIGILGVFLFILKFYLNNFVKYFEGVNQGIDALIAEGNNDVTLPPELVETEKKINYIRHMLKQREMEAQLAEQRKNDLVMYLAHDIRTPLTSVIGYLSLLDEAPDMPPEQKAKFTRIALDKASRLEGLVNEFFEITRFNLREIKLNKEEIDLYYMLVQMVDEFYPILSEKGNAAVLHANEDLSLYGDPMKLARVFNNILKNAAAYSFPNSEIVISARKRDGLMIISFENQGPTIPAEKLAMIFERFYRMDEARNSNAGGAGLGLAIAKEIVTLHHGTIAAESHDNATAFTVSLPISG